MFSINVHWHLTEYTAVSVFTESERRSHNPICQTCACAACFCHLAGVRQHQLSKTMEDGRARQLLPSVVTFKNTCRNTCSNVEKLHVTILFVSWYIYIYIYIWLIWQSYTYILTVEDLIYKSFCRIIDRLSISLH